jgi:hypothetical protein
MRRSARPRRSMKRRSVSPTVDRLEPRELLSTVPTAHPMFELGPLVSNPNPPAGAYTPAQIAQAYGFNQISFGNVVGDGTGQTIAIVDAQDDPNIQADLNTFDTRFGLPATTVARVNQTGGSSYPAADSTGGWELEESLDVEWAHAMAPGAKLMLVEANSANDSDLLTAVDYGAAHASVVSMSWGGGEFSGETSQSYEAHFQHAGVTFVASSGDSGAPVSWPASSPNVLAVGGTALGLDGTNNWSSETGWSGSGGGPSAFEPQPSYQSSVVTQTTKRANPDVAYDASPSTGFAVYDSIAYSGTSYGWLTVGGTSAGAPQWASLLAIANQGRALNSLPALNSAGAQNVAATLYQTENVADFHDITTGTSTGSPNYSASAGYDYVTGLGSPRANLVVNTLAGITSAASDTLAVSAPKSDTAGTAFSVTVTAQKAVGGVDTSYVGTIHFTSTDAQASLPASYTFTPADAGSHTFSVTLKTAATQSVTATDIVSSAVKGTASGLVVSPAAASRLALNGLPANATVGGSQSFSVSAQDPYGNVATGFTGKVHFASSDAQASLPADYVFTTNDKGMHTFSMTFATAGTQSVTVTCPASGLSITQPGISVAPAAPTNLAGSAASSTQVNLSWTSAAGASSYSIERSANGSTGWTQVGTSPSGTTTYQDTGLTAGTIYYYRMRAVAGNMDSAYSNTVSVTTNGLGSGNGPTDTVWSNSFTPSENTYAYGPYEIGVKFRSDVAGNVTGVRFYKESWMSGPVHVGHLWSASGALLATATFTKESAAGWQQVTFSSPVSILSNTVYIVSFSTGGGYFGITTNYFSRSGVDSGPLHALSNNTPGGDGVYQVGNGTFPSVSGSGMNFWADVAFSPSSSLNSIVNHGQIVVPTSPSRGMSAFLMPISPTDGEAGTPSSTSGTSGSAHRPVSLSTSPWSLRGLVPQISVAPSGPRLWG